MRNSQKLLHYADSNAVLFRCRIRILLGALVRRRDAVLGDTELDELGGNDLSTLLGEEHVAGSGTCSLVSVTGDGNLGLRILVHNLYDFLDLGELSWTDVPLVDYEEYVLGEVDSRLGSLYYRLWFRLCDYWFRFWFNNLLYRLWLSDWCWSWCWSSLLAEVELETDEGLILMIEYTGCATVLGVEVVREEVCSDFSCESYTVRKSEVHTDTCSSGEADSRVFPEVVVRCEVSLEILSLVVVETKVAGYTCENVRIDGTSLITAEEVAKIECSIETELAIVESIFLALAYGTLALNTREVTTKSEYRRELIAQIESCGRGKEFGEG
jgi:hypothetical protein